MDDRTEIRTDIRFGKPVTRGTRVRITRILAEVAASTPWTEIEAQDGVTADDIRAAIVFASDLVAGSSFMAAGAE